MVSYNDINNNKCNYASYLIVQNLDERNSNLRGRFFKNHVFIIT